MEQDLNTLTILAEVIIAFVAFSAIVASLRINLGQKLSAFQRLLVHFFTEVGMLNVSIALLPLVLSSFYEGETKIAQITIMYIIGSSVAYLVYYIRRRMKIKAPTPITSLLVMIGYGIWLPVMALTLTESIWAPSLGIISAFCLWSLISSAVIFTSFLATFVDPSNPPSIREKNE